MKTDVHATPAAADNLVAVAKGAVLLDLQALDLDEIQRLHSSLVAEVRRRHAEASGGRVQTPKSTSSTSRTPPT